MGRTLRMPSAQEWQPAFRRGYLQRSGFASVDCSYYDLRRHSSFFIGHTDSSGCNTIPGRERSYCLSAGVDIIGQGRRICIYPCRA